MTQTIIQSSPASGMAAGIGHNGSPNGSVRPVPVNNVTVWAPALEQADDVPGDVIDGELAIILEAGQRIPVPARRGDDGVIEVVAAVHVIRAVERYNELNPDCELDLEGDCQDFRVRAGIMGTRSSPYVTTQRTDDTERVARPAAGGRSRQRCL